MSIKHVNFLIRKNLADLRIHVKRLLEIMFRLTNKFNIEGFEKNKERALISLAVMLPEESAKIMIIRFFSSNCSLG